MKKYITLLFFVFLSLIGSAQINLVQNPQFEIYDTCPNNFDEVTYCQGWTSLDSSWRAPDWGHDLDGVPEYVNTCSAGAGGSYTYGCTAYQNPRNGNAMMQLMMFNTLPLSASDYQRDYLQGHLVKTLSVGHKYNVFFYSLRTFMSGQAVNQIGAYFDNGTIDTTHHPSYLQNQFMPQVTATSIISDSANWTKVEGTFIANGTERLITIGQYSDSAHTSNYPVTSIICSGSVLGLYFIDDVSVIDCDNIPHAGNDTVIHPGDSAFLGPHENLLPYTWYKLGSSTAIDSGGGIWVKPTVTTTYVVKQVLCGRTSFDTVKVWVWPDTPTLVGSQQLAVGSVRVYPNPAFSEVKIDGAKGCDVIIFDVLGRPILKSECGERQVTQPSPRLRRVRD